MALVCFLIHRIGNDGNKNNKAIQTGIKKVNSINTPPLWHLLERKTLFKREIPPLIFKYSLM